MDREQSDPQQYVPYRYRAELEGTEAKNCQTYYNNDFFILKLSNSRELVIKFKVDRSIASVAACLRSRQFSSRIDNEYDTE